MAKRKEPDILIPEKVWKKEMKTVCFLIGYPNPPAEQMDAFYHRLKHFEIADFLIAVGDDGLIADLTKERLNMPAIKRYIEKYQAKRENEEHVKRKDEDSATIKDLMANRSMPQEARDALNRLFGKEF
jgi:hypothetical protein